MSNSSSPPPHPSDPSTPSPAPASPPPRSFLSHLTSTRSLRQLSLFLAGASFLTLSTLITHRSITRRRLAIFPAFYHPSNAPPRQPVNSGIEAFEALNVATINVLSFGIMITGGALWAADVSSMEDLRRRVRGGEGADGRGEREVEEEWEEWVAAVMERKRGKEERRRREGGGGDGGVGDGDVGGEEGRVNERGERR